MSRIESGRMELKDEEFSFRKFLNQINVMVGGQCADKGLHYECNIIGKTENYYIGDEMKLKQVLNPTCSIVGVQSGYTLLSRERRNHYFASHRTLTRLHRPSIIHVIYHNAFIK